MKVLGITSEYNPFHNGHLYHLHKSKADTGCDAVVAVMSGNFVQRGGPAMFDKWLRAKCAIACGVDLVVEIPSAYAMASAEFFAQAAVRLMDASGVVDCISFGSEHGDLEMLRHVADLLADEPEDFSERLKLEMKKGLSYISAMSAAVPLFVPDLPEGFLNSSNNILAIEYLKSLIRQKSRIIPYTVKRVMNDYRSQSLTGSVSSATAIRANIETLGRSDNFPENVSEALPPAVRVLLEADMREGRGPVLTNRFDHAAISRLRSMHADEIAALPFMGEGLANRIKNMAAAHTGIDQLVRAAATKRYHDARVRRAIFSLFTGTTHKQLMQYNRHGGPQYIKVLGFTATGALLLREMQDRAALPVIIKAADAKNNKTGSALFRSMLEAEAAATDQYVLGYSDRKFAYSGQEFTQKLIFP